MQDMKWDDLRIFLAVARNGQIGQAARRLQLDPTTLGRRLKRLEERLGQRLLERTRAGQLLTEAGEALLAKVEQMDRIAWQIADQHSPGEGLTGTLRLSVSEGFGSQFLTPYLADFMALHPHLTLELVASSGFLSPSKREADIAVLLSRPKTGPVICRKLSDYRLQLYASKAYLQRNGCPQTPEQLANGHTLISYVPDLLYAPELNFLDEFHAGMVAQIQSSSINAQHRLIEAGAGIGVLPCFIGEGSALLECVCPRISVTRSFWQVTHRDTQTLARVQAGKQWLAQCVSAGRDRLLPA